MILPADVTAGLLPDAHTSPFWVLFVTFGGIAFVRNQAFYWIARSIATRALTQTPDDRPTRVPRMRSWIEGGGTERGIAAIHRWGVAIVPASYLLPGTKTVVNTAAGVTRMPFARYLPAMLVGSIAHGVVYATIGWAAWTSLLAAFAGSLWGLAALVALVTAIVVHVVRRRARRRAAQAGATGASTAPP
jgi:membrane protein DedA with SNARE-associated domain